MQPLVSIILPTFNRGYCLRRTIQSVILQTFKNWELIIIDNYSTDDTRAVINSFDDKRIILLNIRNDGIVATSRNKGLAEAKGRYVAFLDSDDWWLPEKLKASIDCLLLGAKLVYHDLYLIDSSSQRTKKFRRVKTRQVKSPIFFDLLFNGSAITNSSVVVDRDLLIQIGGFSEDPALVAAEDYEAWLRLAMYTESFIRIDETLGCYWSGGGNLSSPKHTICYLTKLRELYYINLMPDNMKPLWTSYNLALANWLMGNIREGNCFAKEVIISKPISFFSIKLIIFWIHLKLFSRNFCGYSL